MENRVDEKVLRGKLVEKDGFQSSGKVESEEKGNKEARVGGGFSSEQPDDENEN